MDIGHIVTIVTVSLWGIVIMYSLLQNIKATRAVAEQLQQQDRDRRRARYGSMLERFLRALDKEMGGRTYRVRREGFDYMVLWVESLPDLTVRICVMDSFGADDTRQYSAYVIGDVAFHGTDLRDLAAKVASHLRS